MAEEIGRRAFLRTSGSLALLGLIPGDVLDAALAAAPAEGRFLTAHELALLRAVTARFVSNAPAARVPEAIDLLLGVFRGRRRRIHAGGPFSGRHGGHRDDFARYVALDRQAELGWRIRIEG